jgi:hypothetical protein
VDSRVEVLTQGGENDGQWKSLANQFADLCGDFGEAESHQHCCSVFCRGAISVAMTWRQQANMPLR